MTLENQRGRSVTTPGMSAAAQPSQARTWLRPGSRLRAAVSGFGVALIVAIAGLTAYSIWDSHEEALAAGRKTTEVFAHVLEAQTRHAFMSAEQSLLNVERMLRLIPRGSPSRAADLDALLLDMADRQPHVQAIFIIDRNGRVVHGSGGAAAANIDVSDNEYFQAHRDHPDLGLYVGPPLESRVGNGAFICVSRRLNGADGAFDGVAVAAIESGYFQKFYTQVKPGGDSAIGLFLRDGTLLFRGPPKPDVIGKSFAPFLDLLRTASSGSYSGASPVDGVARVFSYRALDGLPLVVVVGASERQILAGWRGYVKTASLLALIVILVTIVLTKSLAREVGRREALAASLKDGERQYRTLFEASPHPMWIYDPGTLEFLVVNDAALASYGYSRDEFLAMTPRDLRPPEDWPRFEQLLSSLNPALNLAGVWRHKKKGGEVIRVEVTSHGIDFEGRAARLVQAQDVGARLDAEIRLCESEQHYRSLYENNPHPVLVRDDQTLRILSANQAAVDKYGYTLDELKAMTTIDLQCKEDRAQVAWQIRERRATGTTYYQRRHVTKGGSIIDVEVTAQPFVFGGRPAHMVLIDDVTERLRAETARARLAAIVDGSDDAIVSRTLDGIITSWNSGAEAMFGYTAAQAIGQPITFIYPQGEQPGFRQNSERLLRGETIASHELQRVTRDGRIIDVLASLSPVRDGAGNITGASVIFHDITERVRIKRALHDSEERLRTITDNVPALIGYIDTEERYQFVNKTYEAWFGLERDACIGRTLREVIGDTVYGKLQPHIEAALAGKHATYDRIHAVQGRTSSAVMSYIPDFDSGGKVRGFYFLGYDVTERKLAEEALEREHTLLRTVIDNLPDRIYAKNSALRYMLANQADLRHRRFATDEAVLGKTAHDILPRKYADAFDAEDRAVLESGKPLVDREFVMETGDGQKAWFMANKVPLRDAAGNIFGLVGIHRDITEVRQNAEAIVKLNAELEQRVIERTAQLVNANKELESFAYSVSHDLRAPLRSIDGFSKALMDDYQGRLEPAALDYLRRVRAASQRMAKLIDDLLSLSRITRGEMRLKPLDLSALAEDIVSELRRGQPQREIDFSVESGIRVSADAGLMRVALDNLLGNAWKFTGRQPRAIISVGVESRDGQPVYFVRDNGAGFDMQYADKLFSAFQRLHREADFAGTGVGLATVQRIIHRHGGQIWTEAAVGKGATFFFTLG